MSKRFERLEKSARMNKRYSRVEWMEEKEENSIF